MVVLWGFVPLADVEAIPEAAGSLGSGTWAAGNECRCDFPSLQQMPNLQKNKKKKNAKVYKAPHETVGRDRHKLRVDTEMHTHTNTPHYIHI